MQHDRERRGDMNKFAVHLNMVAGVGLCAEVSAGFTVDRDSPRRNQFVAVPARSNTGRSEKTVEAHDRDS
jgi:hypothetical protein